MAAVTCRLRLEGLVGSAQDGRAVRAGGESSHAEGDALGARVASLLLEAGAGAFLPG